MGTKNYMNNKWLNYYEIKQKEQQANMHISRVATQTPESKCPA